MYNNPKYKYQFYAPMKEDQDTPVIPGRPKDRDPEEEINNNIKKPKKNLITVLKKLLVAFGGEDTQSNNAVEVIDKIADSVEQGGGGSGGNSPFVFTITETLEGRDPPTYSCDKTHTEIYDAAQNNAVICHIVTIRDGEYQGGASCGNVSTGNGSVTVTTHHNASVGVYNITGNTVTYRNIN